MNKEKKSEIKTAQGFVCTSFEEFLHFLLESAQV